MAIYYYKMEDVISLSKRFNFPIIRDLWWQIKCLGLTNFILGNAGFFDYGPLGIEMKKILLICGGKQ